MHQRTIRYLLLIVIATISAAGQPVDTTRKYFRSPFQKRTYALSGSLSYNSTTYSQSDQSTRTFTMSPSFLYFTTPKFALGGQLVYTSINNRSKYGESGTTLVGIGPLLRFYPFEIDPLPFLSAGVYITSISVRNGDLQTSGPTSSYAAVSIGFDFLTGSMFSIEPYVEYKIGGLESSVTTDGITVGVTFLSFHP